MPIFVMACEACGTRKPFNISDEELAAVQEGKPLAKYCPACHAASHWIYVFPERRGGRDRRQAPDRRTMVP